MIKFKRNIKDISHNLYIKIKLVFFKGGYNNFWHKPSKAFLHKPSMIESQSFI